jgi:hypothetical protein
MRYTEVQRGQVLLITLLVLAVAVTIVLSLVSRTTGDVALNTQTEESTRAFSAAEAGIEQSLKLQQAVPNPTPLPMGTKVNVTQQDIGDTTEIFEFPNVTTHGFTSTLWLVPHDTNGKPVLTGVGAYAGTDAKVCWNDKAGAAMDISLYYEHAGDLQVGRVAVNPAENGPLDSLNNKFLIATEKDCSPSLIGYSWYDFNFSAVGFQTSTNDVPVMLRLRPLYADTQIAVVPVVGEKFPAQGREYVSCGTTPSNVKRCVQVDQYYKTADGLLDYVVFAGNGSFQTPSN